MLFPAAARFAAHLAFIAAESCARRSGERFSFLFAFVAMLGSFASVAGSRDFFPADAVARAADFRAAFNAFADSACCNLRLSLASFCGPSRRRFSSCWIFFFNFFDFIIAVPVNDKIPPMSRHSFAGLSYFSFIMLGYRPVDIGRPRTTSFFVQV